MYESHFGFSGSPFQLNPDPSFYFGSRGHSNALAYLKFGAHQGEGFIVVTGEIGAGKTTLVRTLLEGLNPDQVVAAQIVSTQLESGELLQAILMAFGVASNSTSKAHLIASLEGFLTVLASKGRRALLIIDEAQNLRHEAVEELRMLSNFQLGKYGLLQSFLVGQPELRGLLQSKSMEQLRQRVIASCHLGPLDNAETRAYVEHRLRLVGWKGVFPDFAGGALDRVHQWTGGVPRTINRLCNRLLLGAFLAEADVVTAAMVDETALELKAEIGDANTGLVPPLSEALPNRDTPARPLDPPVLSGSSTASPASAAAMPSIVQATPAPEADGLQAPRAAHFAGTTSRADSPTEVVTAAFGVATNKRQETPVSHAEPGSDAPASQRVVRRAHDPVELLRPLFCLVDSALDYLKAGVLAEVFRGFPSLPRIVAVHPGVEADLRLDDVDELQMPFPALSVHLGIPSDAYAPQTSKLINAFDALLSEFDPCMIMVLGSSDADLACSLLARKRGFHLLRAGSGKRNAHRASNGEMNSVIVERIADVLYTDSTESFYALYREGIRLDRVHSVGCLTREVLDIALAKCGNAPSPSTIPSNLDPALLAGGYGLITVDPRAGFSEPGSLSTAIELFCELSQELPLAWMVQAEGRRHIEYSNCAQKIEASRVTLLEPTGVGQALAVLRAAKCLIARDDGAWLPEARSLGIPTLVLTSASSLESGGSAADPAALEILPSLTSTKFRHLLDSPGSASHAPEYWDGGTASRIAAHLVSWFSKAAATSRPSAQTASELVNT